MSSAWSGSWHLVFNKYCHYITFKKTQNENFKYNTCKKLKVFVHLDLYSSTFFFFCRMRDCHLSKYLNKG